MTTSGLRRARLTRVGWAAAGVVVCFGVAGRVTGIQEFVVAALAVGAVVIGAWVVAAIAAASLQASRTVHSARVTAGAAFDTTIEFPASRLPFRLPVEFVDRIDRVPSRHRLLSLPRGPQRVSIPVRAMRRGAIEVGPATIRVSDSLGLVASSCEIGPVATVLAVPPVIDLRADASSRVSSTSDAHAPRGSALVSDEFASLREYVTGDDLRLVDWSATARVGALTVREFEPLAQHQTTIVLHRGTTLESGAHERAIIAAASVAAVRLSAGDTVRLVVDDERANGDAVVVGGLDEALDRLAVLGPPVSQHDTGHLLVAAGLFAAGSSVVVCCTSIDAQVLALCAQASTAEIVVVSADPDAAPIVDADEVSALRGSALRVVRFGLHDSLLDSWHHTVIGTSQ